MKQFFVLLFSVFAVISGYSQNAENNERPKLIVGIVVDQMRYDYLTRFYDKYGDGGFKRLMNEGFNCKNNHYNYVPTYTGPGHASVYTGTTPKYHGIISNNWYDKKTKKEVYCASDSLVSPVGTQSDDDKMSPRRMLTTTFADENRLFTQLKGKSIGISIKDRGAILAAGHSANAAYWFHGSDIGKWVTSSYYMKDLPKWVKDFNSRKNINSYLKTWKTLYPITMYTESGDDLNNFEGGFDGKETATFPYNLKKLKDKNWGYSIIKSSPFGNTLTTDFALEALVNEDLGKDALTDVLTISYSSTDYIGHNFGVNSKEVQDTYLRLDKDLERLLSTLDDKVGKDEYTVFLTSDHGAVHVPKYLQTVGIPSGYFNPDETKKRFLEFLVKKFGTRDIVESVSNDQVFLNKEKLAALNLKSEEVQRMIADELITYSGIDKVYTAAAMRSTNFTQGIEVLLQNGYHQKRSGDVLIVKSNAVISYGETGSTHGSGNNYDTHVPLLFYGNGIKKGNLYRRTNITDIAPTISALLQISFPNGATGEVIPEVLGQ
ncbi:MAG: alkaline phosphatase family protein [Flavobacteriaceae bacterium]|nr:alkaline phosphatase family protein [Flavobacteriaceae bacterium]